MHVYDGLGLSLYAKRLDRGRFTGGAGAWDHDSADSLHSPQLAKRVR